MESGQLEPTSGVRRTLAILVVLEPGDIATAPLRSRRGSAGIVAALCLTVAGPATQVLESSGSPAQVPEIDRADQMEVKIGEFV
jgi:hypothetical protein